MNSQDNKNISKKGIVLNDNVDLEWLNGIEPKFHGNMIKFDVNLKLNKVAVGMDLHASTQEEMGNNPDLLGGWIQLNNGVIEYDSTLNIPYNLKLGTHGDTMREIVDEDLIGKINNVVFEWVIL